MMRQALDVDWQAIKAAFIIGISVKQLATQYGIKADTIHHRAYREEWAVMRQKAVMATVQSNQGQTLVLSKTSEPPKADKPASIKLREAVAVELQRDLEAVARIEPRSLASAKRRQEVLSSIVQAAKPVHGWGESQQSTLISLGMLSGDAPAIDVPATQTPQLSTDTTQQNTLEASPPSPPPDQPA